MKRILFFVSILLSILGSAQASTEGSAPVENPPVYVESMFGNRGVVAQLSFEKRFKNAPKFGVMGQASLLTKWGTKEIDDFVHQMGLTFEVIKNINLIGGYYYVPFNGVNGSFGIQYTLAKNDWLWLVTPRVDIMKNGGMEVWSLFQYTPKLNDQLNFYSNVQGLYNVTAKNFDHGRSYVWVRAGLSYKEFTFGLASDFDFFDVQKREINNFGIFVGANL